MYEPIRTKSVHTTAGTTPDFRTAHARRSWTSSSRAIWPPCSP